MKGNRVHMELENLIYHKHSIIYLWQCRWDHEVVRSVNGKNHLKIKLTGQYGDQQEPREEPQGVPPVLSRAHRGNQQEPWDTQPILPRASWILQLTKEALRIMID